MHDVSGNSMERCALISPCPKGPGRARIPARHVVGFGRGRLRYATIWRPGMVALPNWREGARSCAPRGWVWQRSFAIRDILATRNGRPYILAGGRAFLRAMWLRSAKVICDARYSGDQEWSPSQIGGRARVPVRHVVGFGRGRLRYATFWRPGMVALPRCGPSPNRQFHTPPNTSKISQNCKKTNKVRQVRYHGRMIYT